MVEDALARIGLNLGGGAALGFLAGYAAKKVSKLVVVIIGGLMILFKWLESREIISVDWGALTSGLVDTGSTAASGAPSFLSSLISTLGVGGAFAAGALLGFKRG